MSANRRKHEREPVLRYCAIECSLQRWSCRGKIRDISDGGIGVEVLKAPDIRDEIKLYMFDEKGRQLVKDAVVAWCSKNAAPGLGSMVGLQFV
jgi:c-di-GMP-binding flagellar brake protein YcgR